MKKTILNFAAIAVIATTSFIACDKKQATDAAPAADSTQVDSTATAAPAPAPAADSTKVDSTAAAPAQPEAAPAKADETKK